MAKDILIAYSTTDGHTRNICQRIAEIVRRQGHTAELVEIGRQPHRAMEDYDTIVVGASIRYGHHSPAVHEFIVRHAQLLSQKANAFFSVNAVARKANKRQADTNPYVRKFLRRIPWQPQQVEVFGGKIDYPRYGTLDRAIIRFIMRMTGGPTDPASVTDFTDWDQVEAFARRIAA